MQPDIVNKTKSLALSETEQMGRSATVISQGYLRRAVSFASCSSVAQGYCGHRDQQRNNFLQLHSEGRRHEIPLNSRSLLKLETPVSITL